MPQQSQPYLMNQFSKGLKTEFTGLNYPENAATAASNCIFNRIGNTTRRPGINYETNFAQQTINRTSLAINTYRWNNVGGDGPTRVLVTQVGTLLRFYKVSAATVAAPLSNQILASTIDISTFVAPGGSFDSTVECQFTDGNGYLFVFHPTCDPFYVVYTFGSPDTVAGTKITVQIRDFTGIPESGVADNFRPPALSNEHSYNIQNQGWTNSPAWSASSSTTNNTATGSHTWTIQLGLTITAAQVVNITANNVDGNPGFAFTNMSGVVTSYNSGTGALVLNVTSTPAAGHSSGVWSFQSITTSFVTSWFTSQKTYPSNADVWWNFKNVSNAFDVATIPNVVLASSPAPKGYYILSAFQQLRSGTSGISSLTDITTTMRPKTGIWFAGRIWYAGTDAQQNATGDAPNYTWTENLYFSQIIVKEDQFGKCYQANDPTSQDLFNLLPTDGGTFRIQGSGSIYKLFPFQNGLLVFAANGVWFITGSQGIGFTANDYTISRLSTIQTISSTSFVDVQGVPMWWNEEAIYTISMGNDQGGTAYGPTRGALGNGNIAVEPMTYSSIQTFYDAIPLQSKKYIRGDFDAINWEVKWIFRSTNESSVTDRYQFDSLLTYSTITQAFSPWSVATTAGVPYVHAVNYIQGPGGSTSPAPILKYYSSIAIAGPSYKFTFAEENDFTRWKDWHSSGTDYDYTSTFTTGYLVHGRAAYKFQDSYLSVFLNNISGWSYRLQGIWDYALSSNSGKFTTLETNTTAFTPANFGVVRKRVKIPGRGFALQFKFVSTSGAPFDIIGWAVDEKVNQAS